MTHGIHQGSSEILWDTFRLLFKTSPHLFGPIQEDLLCDSSMHVWFLPSLAIKSQNSITLLRIRLRFVSTFSPFLDLTETLPDFMKVLQDSPKTIQIENLLRLFRAYDSVGLLYCTSVRFVVTLSKFVWCQHFFKLDLDSSVSKQGFSKVCPTGVRLAKIFKDSLTSDFFRIIQVYQIFMTWRLGKTIQNADWLRSFKTHLTLFQCWKCLWFRIYVRPLQYCWSLLKALLNLCKSRAV